MLVSTKAGCTALNAGFANAFNLKTYFIVSFG